MKHGFTLAFVTGLVVLTTACTQAPAVADTHDADLKAIKDNDAQWVKDFASKDVDKIAAHYADDAILMGGPVPVITGKDAIRSALKDLVSDPAFSLTFESAHLEVAKSGDLAVTQGSFLIHMTNPATKNPMEDKGSYVTTYKKQPDGLWKAIFDINVSATPPPK